MTKRRPSQDRLSDPVAAAQAWARYRWIMRWVIAAAMLSVAGALLFLWADGARLTVAVIIATSAGIAFTVLLGGALMGLIFLSSGTGHDEDVASFEEEDEHPSAYWDKRR